MNRLHADTDVALTSRSPFVQALKGWGVRAAHEILIARLRLEALFSRLFAPSRPRVAATACWTFPVYSQTFVHQEVMALAQAGFAVRFLYSSLGPQEELGHACRNLWPLKRRLLLSAQTSARDFASFRRRMPQKVEALVQDVSDASGLSPDEVLTHEHFLHAFSFARAVEAWRADYVHSYFFYERTLFAFVASRLLGVPRGVSCYADHLLRDYPLKIVPLHMRTCDVVVATSRRIRDELEALSGAPLPHAIVKPNAIDTAAFPLNTRAHRANGDPLRLLTVSRIDPKKGLEYFIDAVRILRNRGWSVDAHIVGAADPQVPESRRYEADVRAQVAAHGLESVVHFAGRRDSMEVRGFLERCHVFVASFVELPNGDKDGIPTAMIEAMSAGAAIVATDAGSIEEIVDDGHEALIVPQRDPTALADAVERLATDDRLATQLSTNAAARARREFDVLTSERPFHERVRHAVERRPRASVPETPL